MLTLLAKAYARVILGVAQRDANSGFRVSTRKTMEAIAPESLTSAGCEIIQETSIRTGRLGLRIKEDPVVFRERLHGETKKTWLDFVRCTCNAIRLRIS